VFASEPRRAPVVDFSAHIAERTRAFTSGRVVGQKAELAEVKPGTRMRTEQRLGTVAGEVIGQILGEDASAGAGRRSRGTGARRRSRRRGAPGESRHPT
jgi:hypothetical protein